jgi:hypothetical protein
MVMMTGTATDNQTGKRVSMKAADLYRIENGMIGEQWETSDTLDLLAKTGLIDFEREKIRINNCPCP